MTSEEHIAELEDALTANDEHVQELEALNAELLGACKTALKLATLDFPVAECKQQLMLVIAKAEKLR